MRKNSILGLLFIVGALLCGLTGLCVGTGNAIEVAHLSPVTVAGLTSGTVSPGDKVLVEGYVSEENEVVCPMGNLVAYLYEHRHISINDSGQAKAKRWRKWYEVTPPLLLNLPDGAVQVENDDYRIDNPRVVEGPKTWVSGSHIRYAVTRYEGIAVGDPVIAVGTVRADHQVPHIEAEFVARGTREEYIAGQRTGGLISCGGSAVVGFIGGVIMFWEQVRRFFRR